MDFNINSICNGESIEQISGDVLKATGINLEDAHFKKEYMAIVSERIKNTKGNFICFVPFSVTVEAEAFGAKVKPDKVTNGVLIDGFKYSTIEELSNIKEFDLNSGRIKEVLDCVEILSNRGNIVSINVEAPFTILTLLIDSLTIFKGFRKHGDVIYNALLTIQNSIRKYILKALEKGAKIISYADPSADIDIVGHKIYRKYSGEITYNLIKSLEGHLNNSIIHLCARTSLPLERLGFCNSKPIKIKNNITYGDAICSLLNEENIKVLGHKCISCVNKTVEDSVVWNINIQYDESSVN